MCLECLECRDREFRGRLYVFVKYSGVHASVPGGARLHDYCLLAGGQQAGRR